MLCRMMLLTAPRLTALAVAVCLSGCGSQPASLATGVSDSTKHRLLAAADSAAKSNGGKAKRVEAVETSRGKASDLTGNSNLDQSEKLWVVQVSGDHYVCGLCSHPSGVKSPQGDYITLTLRASDFAGTDFGLSPRATDLAALGEVHVLRSGD
jgi:hypothetical protein